jgi:hypothetical protein
MRLNIYVPTASSTLNTCLGNAYHNSLVGDGITWTNKVSTNGYYFNTAYNIYIYPVANVENERYKDRMISYYTTNNSMRPTVSGLTGGYRTDVEGNRVTITRNVSSEIPSSIDFRGSKELTSIYAISNQITNMSNMFRNCTSLTGNPICAENVTNMANTYYGCTSITGAPVCGDNVTNMANTYYGCTSITGAPVCGNNVKDMSYAYYGCTSITGAPLCGPNVTNMSNTYRNCTGLTGYAIAGPNVTNIAGAYYGCKNIKSNVYLLSNKITNVANCFGNLNTTTPLNIYVPANSTTLTTCLYTNAQSLVGNNISWTNQVSTNGYYFNTAYNIYIYPVANVENEYNKVSTYYDIEPVEGANYGFELNSNGYWESNNKGLDNTAA